MHPQPVPAAFAVNKLIPMLHVTDVRESVRFYALLGFTTGEVASHENGKAYWASLASGSAQIMFAAASGPIDAEQQAVIVYLYSSDVTMLRSHLLKNGLHDGGTFTGKNVPHNGRRLAFEIARPFYMPAGELRIADPDGYCLLVGQLG